MEELGMVNLLCSSFLTMEINFILKIQWEETKFSGKKR
jgi:hypothetical protein